MAQRPIIRYGDRTSHGGTVLDAFLSFDIYGKPAAGVGHQVYCPKCKGNFPIIQGAENCTFMGQNIAVEGMFTACGATLIASQVTATVDYTPGSNKAGYVAPHAMHNDAAVGMYDMHWSLKGDNSGKSQSNIPYKIILEDGAEIIGTTDKNGLTQKVSAESAQLATIIAPYYGDNTDYNSDEIDTDCSCCADCG